MSITSRGITRICAAAGGTALVLAGGAFPAVAAEDDSTGDVQVINTETVQAYTDATGKVQSKRLYEQLALTGEGDVELANPVETSGLRNLNGFSGFDVVEGDQIVERTVDGEENIRSVSDYDEDLPLQIDVEYVLDGEPISPKSLVGESGELQVTYTVRNITNRMETISYTDGKGGMIQEETEIMMPMVGSLSTELPSNFRDVEAEGANAAGDGKGGTRLSYTMTLLAPLGSDTVQLGYTATVVDAVAPDATVSALPVNPLDNPTLSNAAKSYKGGADTGEDLAAGATQIDENLLKLRDGASDLLAGLIKLRNGADQLSDGLQNEAAPGAQRLADGAGELNDGLDLLDDGAGRLADGTQDLREGTGVLLDGAGRLDDGAGRLADGTGRLSAGADRLDDGAGELAGGAQRARAGSIDLAEGLSGLVDALKQLRRGVATLDSTVGPQVKASDEYKTLIGALTQVIEGIGQPADMGPGSLLGALNAMKAGINTRIAPGVNQVKQGLDAATSPGGSLDQLIGGLTLLNNFSCTTAAPIPDAQLQGPLEPLQGLPGPVQCAQLTDQLRTGANASKVNLQEASDGLGQVYAGLVDASAHPAVNPPTIIDGLNGVSQALYNTAGCNQQTGANCGIAQVLQLVQGGIPLLVDGVLAAVSDGLLQSIGSQTANCDPTKTLLCAAGALAAGSGELSTGLGDLADGAGRLADGTGELKAGAGELDDGAGQLAAGTGELSDGVGRLDAGANRLADGAGQLKGGTAKAEAGSLLIANGAAELAEGLFAAAGGSGLLAEGLATAAQGAPKLVDGAQRLSDEGTKKLVEAGEDTAQEYGKQYAQIMAGAERAQDGKMIVGAPEDSVGLAAYSFEIQGEDGEGGRNIARTLGGLALLGAGAGLFALRRRLV
jgi:putative membrane protein